MKLFDKKDLKRITEALAMEMGNINTEDEFEFEDFDDIDMSAPAGDVEFNDTELDDIDLEIPDEDEIDLLDAGEDLDELSDELEDIDFDFDTEEIEDDLEDIEFDEELEENTTASTPGYLTPNAFSTEDDFEDDDFEDGSGYDKVNESRDSPTPKETVNGNIREINVMLQEIEKKVKRNLKLKNESGLSQSDYWKPTITKFKRINESILRIARMINDLSA